MRVPVFFCSFINYWLTILLDNWDRGATKKKIDKCLKACNKFNPVIIDKTNKSIVIQITALRREIDKMNLKLKPLGLISTSRTGAIAMTRGAEIFN